MSFNKVIIMGNLTRDLVLRQTQSGTSICNLNIALNRKQTANDGSTREDVVFVDCVSFGKTADVLSKYFSKGKPILIEGSLRSENWTDKESGKQRSKLVVAVEKFEFVQSTNEVSRSESPGGRGTSQFVGGSVKSESNGEGLTTIGEDVPF